MTDAEYIALEKSTIVRSSSEPWSRPLVRLGNRMLSALAPELGARLAERLFLTPPRPRRPAPEIELIASARARPTYVGGRRIETWRWGAGPSVLLVHGWGGRGAQLGAFIGPLVARGFSVVTFDAPGHGASDRGMTTIREMTSALRKVAASHGPLAGLIAHSVGAVTATRALYEGLEVGAAIFIAPAADLVTPAVRFTEALGFSRTVRDRMQARVQVRVGEPWSTFDVTTLAPALNTPLLVIHDRGDAEAPWQHGTAITSAWRGAEMLMTDALGHRRIVRAPEVVAAAVTFVAARSAQRRPIPLIGGDLVESLPTVGY